MGRTHDIKFGLWLDGYERAALRRKSSTAGLSETAYLRRLILGYEPKARPPQEYYDMMQQLYRIGTNLNQIALKAHTLGVIDAQRYDEVVRDYRETVRRFAREARGPARRKPDGND